jgi:hypothetical protein
MKSTFEATRSQCTGSADVETQPILDQINEPEDLARRLEATGDYKVLRRLKPQQPAGCGGKVGIIVEVRRPAAVLVYRRRTRQA